MRRRPWARGPCGRRRRAYRPRAISAGRWACAATPARRPHGSGCGCCALDALAQRRDVLHSAGLVVDGHAGGQHRVFVDLGQEFLRVNASVRPGHDLDDGEALVLQRADGALHAGVFKARDDDLIAPVLTRAGRAGHGHVVALTAAGREVDFIAAAVQRFGHAGAGRGNGILRGNGGVIQAAGVGPKLSQRLADGLRHRRVHPGRGGVIKIMQLGVGKHSTHSSHYCTKLYRLNYTRSPSKKQYSETKKASPVGEAGREADSCGQSSS